MRLPKMFCPSESFAVRLTWRIVGTLFLISLVLAALFLALIWTVGFLVLSAFYWSGMDLAGEKINNVFTAVEIAVSNNITEAEESINGQENEFFAIEHLLTLNPNIVGAAVATNPEVGPHKGRLFSPYAYHDSTGIHTKQLTSADYDYTHQEWFTKPLDEGKGIWTDPYVDEGGGEVLMITYSMPIINPKGEMYAVQTADIDLGWLTKQADRIDSLYNNRYYAGIGDKMGHSRSFITTQTGVLAVHPDRNFKGVETLQDYFQRRGAKRQSHLEKEILDGDQDLLLFTDIDGNTNFIFVVPILHTGWVIGIIIPLRDIIAPVNVFIIGILVALILGLLIVALVCRRNIHKMIKPLSKFADSADEIAKGNLDTPLPVIKSKDEMFRLHNSLSTMQQSLIAQIEQIKNSNEEKGRIESELLIARNIQMSMLPMRFPAFPDRTDLDVFAQLYPAKEVGGDLYDYLIRDEKLYFCVGDVSGKGIPASMVMMVTRALFHTASAHESNPAKILGGINEQMVEDNDSNMFVTMFIGVIDLPTGRMRYCNAGHNAPLLVNDEEVVMLPCDANLPLGVMENWKFTMQEVTLKPPTTVFLYTDGVTEAENLKYEQFQEERMFEVARQAGKHPQTLIEQMKYAVKQFVGDADQFDDMTMLAVQYCKMMSDDSRLSRTLNLTNDVEQVPQLAAFVDEVCEELEFDMSTIMSMNLAIEEAVVNVMSYAYPAGTVGDIKVEAKADDIRLKFIISDWGKPFDPTTQDDIDTTLSAEERHIGGLGIHLVRQIMDSINYERIEGMNVLTLRKKLTKDS